MATGLCVCVCEADSCMIHAPCALSGQKGSRSGGEGARERERVNERGETHQYLQGSHFTTSSLWVGAPLSPLSPLHTAVLHYSQRAETNASRTPLPGHHRQRPYEFSLSFMTGTHLLSFNLSTQLQRQTDNFPQENEKISCLPKNDWYPNIVALKQFSSS